MAKIIEVKLPPEYEDVNRYEMYTQLEKVATYAHKLQQQIEDLQAEIKLRDSQLQKQRGDILKLKAFIGHQKLKIDDLELQSDIQEAEFTIVNETPKPNYISTMVFGEVTGSSILKL